MSIHNVCFHGEISILLVDKKTPYPELLPVSGTIHHENMYVISTPSNPTFI